MKDAWSLAGIGRQVCRRQFGSSAELVSLTALESAIRRRNWEGISMGLFKRSVSLMTQPWRSLISTAALAAISDQTETLRDLSTAGAAEWLQD
jgi:hypothetical protein